MQKQTEADRVFRFDENRKIIAIDYERNIYQGSMEEALELSETELFQIKRSPETEHFFEGTDAAYALFGRKEIQALLSKQDVTQHLFLIGDQRMTDMNKYDVLANLREFCDHYYGEDRDEDDIYEAFGTFSENGSESNAQIIIKKGKGNDMIAHIDVENATNFVLHLDSSGTIKSVEIA